MLKMLIPVHNFMRGSIILWAAHVVLSKWKDEEHPKFHNFPNINSRKKGDGWYPETDIGRDRLTVYLHIWFLYNWNLRSTLPLQSVSSISDILRVLNYSVVITFTSTFSIKFIFHKIARRLIKYIRKRTKRIQTYK